jgi:4-amino-4-deoxy-L-arabinose transferase-like glycosyltransferase
LAVVCIRSTHRVFSPTADEPVHVAAGYEYLTQHKYTIDSEHPPLARAVFALPLASTHVAAFDAYAAGGDARQLHLADALLGANGDAMGDIAKARAGNLLFVVIAIVAVALLGRELFGDAAGLSAAIAFVLTPSVLAHGGLATTDMAGTAAVALALFVLYRWLPSPSWGWTIALGLAVGLGALCKFTFLLFFGICAVICVAPAILPARSSPDPLAGRIAGATLRIAGATLIAFVVVWGGYFFHHSRMVWMDPTAPAQTEHVLGSRWIGERVNLPAPQYLFGLLRVKQHDERGTSVYLLGRVWPRGRWYYFPLVLAIKTPIPLLLLFAIGIATLRRHREIAVMALALLLAVIPSHINLGVRHILPIFVFVSILAAVGCLALWKRQRIAGGLLVAWLIADVLAAHPDYLPWMNAFAGSHPERVVVESNFDWGQDLHRLALACRQRHITSLRAAFFTTTDPHLVGVPMSGGIDPYEPSHGWIAISESILEPEQSADPNRFAWLTRNGRAFTRIGKGVRLYYVSS